MSYNLTNITEANSYIEIVEGVNDLTGGLYINVVLLIIFFAVFIIFKNFNTKAVFVADSFLVSVVAALAFFAGLCSWHILVLPVLMLFSSIILLMFSQ